MKKENKNNNSTKTNPAFVKEVKSVLMENAQTGKACLIGEIVRAINTVGAMKFENARLFKEDDGKITGLTWKSGIILQSKGTPFIIIDGEQPFELDAFSYDELTQIINSITGAEKNVPNVQARDVKMYTAEELEEFFKNYIFNNNNK